MADLQTDIRITATNDARPAVNEAKADIQAYGQLGAKALREIAATAQASEGALKAVASISKDVRLVIQDTGKTVRQVASIYQEGARASRDMGKAGKETGQQVEQGAERGRKGATAMGTAIRAALEVASHVGPEATKRIAEVAASTVDLTNKARGLGKSGQGFDGFAEGARRAGDAIDKVKHKLDEVRKKVGIGLVAGSAAGLYGLARTIAPAATKESELASISALSKSDRRSREIYNTTDASASDSAFNLPELVSAAKTLASQNIFSKRLLTASDDAAAVRPQEFKPDDIARALTRLAVGDSGEALERMRDIGISQRDLEAKGLKFDAGGALSDKSQAGIDRAMEAVVSSIEEKFGGLSKRIATTTLSGAQSNFEDAVGRFKTSIGESFIPALKLATGFIEGLIKILNSIPEPIKHAIAWVAALTYGVGLLVGGFLVAAKTIGAIVFAFKALNFIAGLTGGSVGGLVMSLTRLAGTLVSTLLPSVSTTITGIITKAKMLGAVGLGLGLGTFLADQVMQTQRSRGDRLAAGSVGEAASNAWARLTGGEITGEDGLTDTQRREKAKEDKAAAAQEAAAKAAAAPTSIVSAGPTSIPDFASADEAQTEIERLEDQLKATDSAEEKKALQLKLFYARRAAKHQRQDVAAKKREEAEEKRLLREAEALRKRQLRETGFASSADAAEFGAEADERIAGLRSGEEIGEQRARRSLNAQIRAIKSSDLAKDAKSERISALRDLYAARDAARKADTDAQVSELEAQKALAEGAANAAGQEGAQRQATLRKAAAAAQRIREIGALKARADADEASEAAREAEERLRATQDAKGGGSGISALFAAGRLKASYSGRNRLSGGGMFTPGMGKFAGSFIGEGERRADAVRAQSTFAALGLDRAGGNPRERYNPQLRAEAVNIFRDLAGALNGTLNIRIEDGGGNPNGLNGALRT